MTSALDAATYARTSTSLQQSCSTQQALCRQLIEQRGWRQRFKLQDEGEKGASPDRPGYNRLMEIVEERRVQVVVTWKLDRMFRSLKEASIAQDVFQQCKVALVSYTEPFDTTTSIGRFVFGFLVNVAAFETDLIRERSMLGYERRVREGKWTGARVPYAYQRDATGRLSVVDAEKEVVLLMHRNYARLKGDRQLAAYLNREGHTCRGAPWDADRVRRVLTNPTTVGDLTIRGASARHDALAIVPRQRFEQTQRQRQEFRHMGTQFPSARQEAVDRIFSAYLEDLGREDARPTEAG